jgi:hypothetical protein
VVERTCCHDLFYLLNGDTVHRHGAPTSRITPASRVPFPWLSEPSLILNPSPICHPQRGKIGGRAVVCGRVDAGIKEQLNAFRRLFRQKGALKNIRNHAVACDRLVTTLSLSWYEKIPLFSWSKSGDQVKRVPPQRMPLRGL